VQNVEFKVADAATLDFGNATFDSVFCHALLQHVDSPLNVLRELRRVLKPGGVIGVADADFDASVTAPMTDVLRKSIKIVRRTRRNPIIGRDLRALLHEAGFGDVIGSAVARTLGSSPDVKLEGEFYAGYFSGEPFVRQAEKGGWATREELAAMVTAWRKWGDDPGAFSASLWFQAVGRAT
jgi:SAM-dependent methyltransferase